MAATRAEGAGTRAVVSWCLYDWANSAFPAIITTFVFAPYFTRAVAADEIRGTATWGWAVTASALAVAILGPVAGAVADAAGPRKPWLAALTATCVVGTALLWAVRPHADDVVLALVIFAVANAAFEFATIFYNAMLPGVAGRARIGRVSGWAWGLGYAGGLICLAIVLFAFVLPPRPLLGLDREAAEHVRIAAPAAALWYALFALPLFLFVPDRARRGLSVGRAAAVGLATLVASLRRLARGGNIARYLLARMVYTDGLNTLFAFGGIYVAGAFDMEMREVMVFGIVLNATAGAGAFAFAWVDDRIGAKRTVMVALVGLIVVGGALLVAKGRFWLWLLAPLLGIFFGPAQAASRSLMARLAPAELRTEMFGLYALSGKATAFVGPLVLSWATLASSSQRVGMATVLVFFLAGLGLLATVREPAGAERP